MRPQGSLRFRLLVLFLAFGVAVLGVAGWFALKSKPKAH